MERWSDHKVEQITSSRQMLRADILSYSMTGLAPDDSQKFRCVRLGTRSPVVCPVA